MGKARAILIAAVQRHPRTSSKPQLSIISGYSSKSSSFTNALGALRSKGLLEGSGDVNRPTDAGLAAAGPVDALPTGDALATYWAGQLGKAERAIFEVIVRHQPHDVPRDQLSEESGYSLTSSSFTNALGRLRTLELVRGFRLNPDFYA